MSRRCGAGGRSVAASEDDAELDGRAPGYGRLIHRPGTILLGDLEGVFNPALPWVATGEVGVGGEGFSPWIPRPAPHGR